MPARGGRGGKIEKPKDTKGTLVRMGGYLLRYKYLIAMAIILSIASNYFALIGPMLSGNAIDLMSVEKGSIDMNKIGYYVILMIVFYIGSSVLAYLLSVLMINISKRVVYSMRKDVFSKLQLLQVGYYDTHQTGDILSKIGYDIDTVNTSLSNDLIQIFSSLITVVGALVMMVKISGALAVITLITIPLSIVYSQNLTKRTRPLFRKRSAALGELNGFVEETISGQKTIKAYGREDMVYDKFAGVNEEAVEAYYNSDYLAFTMGPNVNFINNLSFTLVAVLGAILFIHGHMTLGSISAFILYSRKFSGPINEVANIIGDLQSALAAAERVFNLLDEEEEPKDNTDAIVLDEVIGKVDLEHVSFGYNTNKTIIKDLSLNVEPGKMVAIVGPTGAGKTTIINLLMRFYDVNSGDIVIDGKQIVNITRESLRKSYAMVLQETWLFGGTIYENIAYGRPDATKEEVEQAAKAACIHNYIMSLPQGYDTMINDDGTNLSKGQKQLITIARAMLLNSKILILDEATSNVDTRTEVLIRKAMKELMKGKTCFVIAHRLSTIVDSDVILVVNQGDVVEQGTHAELMEKKGYYYSMYTAS